MRDRVQGDPGRRAINAWQYRDEAAVVAELLCALKQQATDRDAVEQAARALVAEARRRHSVKPGIDAFLHEYDFSSKEGVVLMCVAEALLRIPDGETADRLLRDQLGSADWERHIGHSESLLVNASTWALLLTGRLFSPETDRDGSIGALLRSLAGDLGEPVIRRAIKHAMQLLGNHFVYGETIEAALDRAREDVTAGYRHSFDMLGEAALGRADADAYLEIYHHAIDAISASDMACDPIRGPGISVKLSALHPRFEHSQHDRVMRELVPRLLELLRHARDSGVGMTLDAEEAHRFELTLDVLEALLDEHGQHTRDGLGLALQAYQKRAFPAIEWLASCAKRHGVRLMLRLVKGAYWDSEIKRAQQLGLQAYPVYTRKAATDIAYLACAERVLSHGDAFFPQFATHNAHTIASLQSRLAAVRDYEFQRLHGMGENLYEQLVGADRSAVPCRVYAPVGSHDDLLPYLVRRLLENGANTSFVNRFADETRPVGELVADPVEVLEAAPGIANPRIPVPRDMFAPERSNARGFDLENPFVVHELVDAMRAACESPWRASPVIDGEKLEGSAMDSFAPAQRSRRIGQVTEARDEDVVRAMHAAERGAAAWQTRVANERAAALERTADRLEDDLAGLMAMLVHEAGKTLDDALAEVREAIDFCRYYAHRCRVDFDRGLSLPGPTGERNKLEWRGRGVFACISPWNFPLAIFTGQVAAALAAGNAVVAKPAEQTPLIACRAVQHMHDAGIPRSALHLLPGGGNVGDALVRDDRVAGVAFTGSSDTANKINRRIASRDGPIVPLIAETGGLNAMVADSSALPQQLVVDVVTSALRSAGQRCSALRILYVQDDIADRVEQLLAGAMAELVIGDPAAPSTDVGPIIDQPSLEVLEAYRDELAREARLVHACTVPAACAGGTYFAPCAYALDSAEQVDREVFGPILHIVRFRGAELEKVIEAINATGYGLTLGIHSRIERTIECLTAAIQVGNVYINRNQVGAVVGVQPFGGHRLSGTGPKAGGPHYLHRFATELSTCTNTAARGGNLNLMMSDDT